MATPLSAAALLKALKAEGCKTVEYRSWRTHNRNHKGPWGPVNGVMIHHTVTSGEDSSVALCYNGHSSLPGPLCHTVGGKSGKLHMVGHGRANHAGSGDDDVLQAVINEKTLPADNETNTDGNRHFYGLEIVNLGNGKDQYPAVQYDAAVRWATAICRAHGWNAASVIGHKEWQPGKIDPHGPVQGRGNFDMDVFRRDVAERLKHPASWNPGSTSTPTTPKPAPKPAPKETDDMPTAREIAAAVMEYQIDNPRTEGTEYVNAKDVLWWAGADSAQANSKVKDLEGQVAALHAKLDRLIAANTQGK